MRSRLPTSLLRCCAAAFALAATLSLAVGTSEWTAALRGMGAALLCAIVLPPILGVWDGALETAETAENASVNGGARR